MYSGRMASFTVVLSVVSVLHARPADVLLDALQPSTLLAHDKSGDGAITVLDALLSVKQALLTHEPCDLDSDGALTAQDTILMIEQIISTSFGDVNGDKTIDTSDALGVLAQLGIGVSELISTDVNFDGVVDGEDLAVVLSRMGHNTPTYSHRLAQRVYFGLGRVPGGQFAPILDDPGSGGGPPWPILGGHSIGVSTTYPDTHGVTLSSWFPDNHLFSVTQNWPTLPPDHNSAVSQGTHFVNFSHHQWPGNHSYAVSGTWGTDPTSHSQSLSFQWHHQPGHWSSQSMTWPPPGQHEQATSRQYPPGHNGALSSQREPTPHQTYVSGGWHDGGTSSNSHGVAYSGMWPANHQANLSTTWPGTHHGNTSTAWPANHQQLASASWPGGFPSWPPNHFAESSNQWYSPQPEPWPVFPQDHSWWTSINDLRGWVP